MPITNRKITINEMQCNRCGAKFFPILEKDGTITLPLRCRSRVCSSPYWNTPRTRKVKPKEKVLEATV